MRPYSYLVLGVNPTSNESDVALNTSIVIRFAKHINVNTLNTNTVRFRKVNGDLIDYQATYDSVKMTYTLTPFEDLDPATQYQTELVGGVEGICAVDDSYLPSNKTYEFSTVSTSPITEVQNLMLEQEYLFLKAKWDMPLSLPENEAVQFDVRVSTSSEPTAAYIWPSENSPGVTTACELIAPLKLEPRNAYYVHVRAESAGDFSEWVTEQIYIEPIEDDTIKDGASLYPPTTILPDTSLSDESMGQIEIVEHAPDINEFTLSNEVFVVFNDAIASHFEPIPGVMPLQAIEPQYIQIIDKPSDEEDYMDPFTFSFNILENKGDELPEDEELQEGDEPPMVDELSDSDEDLMASRVVCSIDEEILYRTEEVFGTHTVDLTDVWERLLDGFNTVRISYEKYTQQDNEEIVYLIEETHFTFYKSRFKYAPYLYVVEAPYKEKLSTLDLIGLYSYEKAIPADVRVHADADNVLVWKALEEDSIQPDKSYTAIVSKKIKGQHTSALGYTYTFGFTGTPEHLHGDLAIVRESISGFQEYFSDRYLLQIMSDHSKLACEIWEETNSYDSSLHEDGKAPYFIDKYVNIQTAIDALINLSAGNITHSASESMSLSDLSISKGAPNYGLLASLLDQLRKRLKPWEDLVHGYHSRGYAKPVVAERAENVEAYEDWHERTDLVNFDAQ